MQSLELEAELLQISMYTKIIQSILKTAQKLSVNKTMLFAYLIKKDKFRSGKIYTANNTRDVVYKAISIIEGDYTDYCKNVQIILKAIHLLIESGRIEIHGTILSWEESAGSNEIKVLVGFIEKAIKESDKMSDKQFIKEVIANV